MDVLGGTVEVEGARGSKPGGKDEDEAESVLTVPTDGT